MNKIKENLMSDSTAKQASAKLKCIDALTCINKFTNLCEDYSENKVNLEEFLTQIENIFNDCKYYGLTTRD